jgi:hypothetical protein
MELAIDQGNRGCLELHHYPQGDSHSSAGTLVSCLAAGPAAGGSLGKKQGQISISLLDSEICTKFVAASFVICL